MMDLSKLPRLSKTDASDTPGMTPPAESPEIAPSTPMAAPRVANEGDWCVRCGAPLLPGAKFCNSCGNAVRRSPGGGLGVEAWISIGLGLFLLLMQPRMTQWLSSRVFHTHFSEFGMTEQKVDPNTGDVSDVFSPVPYTTVPEFWSDLGPTAFAFVLILDGIVLVLIRKRPLVILTFTLTLITVLYNLGYAIKSFSQGPALFSFLAVLIGGMMLFYQWSMIISLGESRVAQQRVA